MAGSPTKLLGAWGESLAADYLRAHGYEIVAANYRCRGGEIDLIARKDGYLAFVEVKLRASSRFAQAREFVDRAKQARIRTTASFWLAAHGCDDQPRFDVVEVYAPEGMATRRPRILHIPNAFE
jgi:putative endonuclease